MVVKEVSNAIATMFGIELKDYNSGIASQEGIYDGIADSADDASKAVKELKRQTLGFDEIHNINENTNSGSGTSVNGGIDQRLLDAITGYDNGMNKVRMKATEIRDRIMEWLGFTKEIDPLTGEVSFKYAGIDRTLSNMWKSFKGLSIEGKVLTGLGLVVGATKLWNVGKKLLTLTGIPNLFKGIIDSGKGLVSFFKNAGTAVSLFGKNTLSMQTILDITFPSIGKMASGFSSLASTLGMSVGTLGLVAGAIVAIGGALIYAYNTNDEFRTKVQDMVSSVKKLLSELFGAISTTCYQIWDVIEPIWTIIKNTVVSIVEYMYESVVLNFSLIFDAINGTCKIISDLIHGDFNQAFEDAKQMVTDLFGDWNTWFEKIKEIFGNLANNIIDSIFEFVPKAINKLTDILTWIKELPNKFFYYAGQAVGTLWKVITETNWVELGKKVLNGIVTGIKNIGTSLWNFGINLFAKIKETISNIDWAALGKSILDGIINGMFNIGQKLKNWGTSFVDGIKDALGIHSPARLVIDAKVGDYTTDGIIIGMKNEIPKLKETANIMVDEVGKTFARGDYDIPLNYDARNNLPNLNTDCSIIQEIVVTGMAQALSQYGGQSSEIDVHVHTDEGTVIDRIEQRTKQTGKFPLTIPTY